MEEKDLNFSSERRLHFVKSVPRPHFPFCRFRLAFEESPIQSDSSWQRLQSGPVQPSEYAHESDSAIPCRTSLFACLYPQS